MTAIQRPERRLARLEAAITATAGGQDRHGLPDGDSIAKLLVLLSGPGGIGWFERCEQAADCIDRGDGEALCGSLLAFEVTPAVLPLFEAFRGVLAALGTSDAPSYKAALAGLRPALLAVLVARPAWRGCQGDPFFGAVIDPRAQGFRLVSASAQALVFARGELASWVAWHTGEAQKWHAFLMGDRAAVRPTFQQGWDGIWQRDILGHALPEAEAAVLIARGCVTQEQVDVVGGLPPIPPGRATEGEKLERELEALA
jgi:hypothetical protein